MYELMLIVTVLIAVGGAAIAYDGSRDVFHPLIFIGPMLAALYGWMPWKLLERGGLDHYFTSDQLFLVQSLYLLGVLAFVGCCLSVGVRLKGKKAQAHTLPKEVCRRILTGAMIVGSIGFVCWVIAIHNVGGFSQAFSGAYGGGYDASGYVRDGAMLLLVGVLLAVTSLSSGGPKVLSLGTAIFFGSPWLANAVLMGRRGPTFMLAVFVLMGWFINRTKRPPLLAVGGVGVCLSWLVLFLVTNRSQIYLGSQFDVKTDVSNIVETADNSNEYVYGSGAVLSARAREHFFWMRRYLAQVMVRPIPSAIWPTKYEDFGVPELLVNAGTGEGFGPTLGWVGAPGSAPGIIADWFIEVSWLAIPAMGLLGWAYGRVWKNAVLRGGPWSSQYVVISALAIYFVMQTMEAVIFRTIMLSLPCWLTWKYALKPQAAQRRIRYARQPRVIPRPRPHASPFPGSLSGTFAAPLDAEALKGTPRA